MTVIGTIVVSSILLFVKRLVTKFSNVAYFLFVIELIVLFTSFQTPSIFQKGRVTQTFVKMRCWKPVELAKVLEACRMPLLNTLIAKIVDFMATSLHD